VEASTHLVPLAALAVRFDLDLRLGVVAKVGRRQGEARAQRAPGSGETVLETAGRLPLALAAKVLGALGSPAELRRMRLVLIVDDFDFADARSRDFVRELVRSQLAAYGRPQDRPLTLVLNTEDADRTEAFLGLRDAASRPERV